MDNRRNTRIPQKLLAATMAAIVAGMAGTAANAQDQAAAEGLEEITVTGSRVRVVTGMTAPTPVTQVTTDELINFNPGSTVAEQLDSLPQFFSTNTAQRGGNAVSTTQAINGWMGAAVVVPGTGIVLNNEMPTKTRAIIPVTPRVPLRTFLMDSFIFTATSLILSVDSGLASPTLGIRPSWGAAFATKELMAFSIGFSP